MTLLQKSRRLRIPAKQFLWFNLFFTASTIVYATFYLIVLLRDTDSVAVPFIDMGIRAAAVFVSFVIGTFILKRVGYVRTFQLAVVLLVIANTSVALLWPNGLDQETLLARYPIFALLTGLSMGMYWPVHHYINVHLLSDKERTHILHSAGWLMTLIGLFLLALGGVVVEISGGVHEILFASAVIGCFGFFVPWRAGNDAAVGSQIRSQLPKLYRRPHFYRYALLLFVDKAQEWLQMTYTIIIPFLIIQDELQTALFIGAIGIVSAVIVYLRRNYSLNANITFAWGAQLSRLGGTLALVWFWTPFMLVVRSIILVGADTVSRPVLADLEARIKQDMLGRDTKNMTVALNFLAEIITLFARVFGALLVALVAFTITDIDSFVRVSWALVAGISILSFGLQVSFWRMIVGMRK